METIDKIKSAIGIGPKVKVVGQIDLDSINQATRPAKKTKEERKKERLQNAKEAKAHNLEVVIVGLEVKRDHLQQEMHDTAETVNTLRRHIREAEKAVSEERKDKETRLAYLREKRAVREKYSDLTLTNEQRQKTLTFQGIRPQKMDVVHFHVPRTSTSEEMDGAALVKDENHYYLAIDMYPQADQGDNATTLIDLNPDGTFEGIWPKYTVLKPASSIEERYIRNLTDKYADELAKAEEIIAAQQKLEADEIEQLNQDIASIMADTTADEKALAEAEKKAKQLNADLLATDAELRRYRQEADDTASDDSSTSEASHAPSAVAGNTDTLLDFALDDIDYEPMQGLDIDSPAEQKYHHLTCVVTAR